MSKFVIEMATESDDAGLRETLRETPMAGAISLSFEREPNYTIAATVEAPDHEIIIGRDLKTGEVMGMGGRSMRAVYLNGVPQTLGYLSQFRVRPKYRGLIKVLMQSWAKLKELHDQRGFAYYYTSIIEDNQIARRFLTRGLKGLPTYTEYARMHTLAIYSKRQKRTILPPNGISIQQGNEALIPEIIACLQRNLQRFQLAPYWAADNLFNEINTPNLTPTDFTVAIQDNRVIGCIGLWDQTEFKQTRVRGYAPALALWRKVINPIARLLAFPNLPPINTEIKYAYASHLAIDEDNPHVYQAILSALHRRAVQVGYDYFMLGMSEAHPLRQITQVNYRHIDYTSLLYWVSWDETLPPIDDRIPAPEIAIL